MMGKMNRRAIFNVGLTVLVLAAAGAGTVALVLSRKKPQKQNPKPAVPKVQAERVAAIERYRVRIVGHAPARARVSVPIVPQVSGRVTEVHDVMIAAEEAQLAFELLLEVRNKLLESYQEIMRMQV